MLTIWELQPMERKGKCLRYSPSFEPEGEVYRGQDLLLCTMTIPLGWWLRKTVVETKLIEGKFWW